MAGSTPDVLKQAGRGDGVVVKRVSTTATKSAPAKKTVAKKAVAKKTVAKKAVAKRAPVKKAVAKRTAAARCDGHPGVGQARPCRQEGGEEDRRQPPVGSGQEDSGPTRTGKQVRRTSPRSLSGSPRVHLYSPISICDGLTPRRADYREPSGNAQLLQPSLTRQNATAGPSGPTTSAWNRVGPTLVSRGSVSWTKRPPNPRRRDDGATASQ